MTISSRTTSLKRLLYCAAILYFIVEWVGASTIVGSKIFSTTRLKDRTAYEAMVASISANAQRLCGEGGARILLFDDTDSVSGYLALKRDAAGHADMLGSCQVVRETQVTPFTTKQVDACDVLWVREFTPPKFGYLNGDLPSGSLATTKGSLFVNPVFQALDWVEGGQQTSADGRFKFGIYHHPCFADKDRGVK